MQLNVGLGGKKVAVGLAWSVIAKSSAIKKREIKKACDESGLSFGIVVEGPEVAALGLCPKKVDHPSAAALLAAANTKALKNQAFAQSNGSWIMIEKITSGERQGSYWLCAVTDGVPVPGTDIVEDLTVISAKLAELIDILEEVDLYTPDQEIQEYVDGVVASINKGFAELTSDVSLPKGGKPQKVTGVPDTVYMGIAAAVVLLMAGLGYMWYADHQATEAKARRLASARLAQQKIAEQTAAEQNADYQRRIAEAERAALNKIEASLRLRPAILAKAWAETLDSLPLNHGGWEVTNAKCDAKACLISLKRAEMFGTNALLLERVPSAQINKEDASYSINLPVYEQPLVSLGALSDWSSFSRVTVSQLQAMKWSDLDGKVGVPVEVTFMPPPTPSMGPAKPADPSQPQVVPKRVGFAGGAVTIDSSRMWPLKEIGEILSSNEIGFEGLDVKFNGGVAKDASWTITGRYFVKSSGAPAGSTGVPLPDLPSLPNGQLPPGGAQPPQNQPLSAMPAGGAPGRR